MRGFLWRLRSSISRFMYGRYGIDKLYYFYFAIYFILVFIGMLTDSAIVYAVTNIASTLLLIYMFFRVFSRNISKRYAEGQKFERVWNKVTSFFKLQRNRLRDRKTHVYRRCKHCKAVLRLPKRKGKHSTTCPRCGRIFNVKI